MAETSELVDFWGKSKSEVWPYFGFKTETNEFGAKTIIKKKNRLPQMWHKTCLFRWYV